MVGLRFKGGKSEETEVWTRIVEDGAGSKASRCGRLACRRSRVPKFLTWQDLLKYNVSSGLQGFFDHIYQYGCMYEHEGYLINDVEW